MHTSKWGGLASRNRDKKKRYYEKVSLNENTDKKYDKVKDERSQWKEKLIIVGRKEVKDNEKEIEGEKQKEQDEKENFLKKRREKE